MRASLAALRPVLDNLIDALERKQRPVLALVPGLAAPLPARARLAWPRRRRGRVLGGRKRGVARAAIEALLELVDAGLEPPGGLDQLADPHQQRDRRLPVAVEDRLCLRPLHTSSVRPPEPGPFLLENHKILCLRRPDCDPFQRASADQGR